jgi:hypothetical protein
MKQTTKLVSTSPSMNGGSHLAPRVVLIRYAAGESGVAIQSRSAQYLQRLCTPLQAKTDRTSRLESRLMQRDGQPVQTVGRQGNLESGDVGASVEDELHR